MESTSLLMNWQSKYYHTENVIIYFKGNLLWRCSAHVQTVFFDFLLTFQNKPVPGCCVQSVQFRICSIISSTVFISVEIFLLILVCIIIYTVDYISNINIILFCWFVTLYALFMIWHSKTNHSDNVSIYLKRPASFHEKRMCRQFSWISCKTFSFTKLHCKWQNCSL